VRQESTDSRVIVARPQVIETGVAVLLLAGKEPIVGAGARLRADGAEDVVSVAGHAVAAAVREVRGGAEAVVQVVSLDAATIRR